MSKHWCRLVTQEELRRDDVIEFYEIVTQVVTAKVVVAHSDGDHDTVEVLQYDGEDGDVIYEILLQEPLTESEGDRIVSELNDALEIDFDFEASVE